MEELWILLELQGFEKLKGRMFSSFKNWKIQYAHAVR